MRDDFAIKSMEAADLNDIIKNLQTVVNQLPQNGAGASLDFTTRRLAGDSVDELVEKYLAAGIRNWRDAEGKFLLNFFPLEVLAKSCPTAEGAGQSKKPPLDPKRIGLLRDFVCRFVNKNIANKEEIPKKGEVTARIHSATRYARDKIAARLLEEEAIAAVRNDPFSTGPQYQSPVSGQ